jgi:TonB family protein
MRPKFITRPSVFPSMKTHSSLIILFLGAFALTPVLSSPLQTQQKPKQGPQPQQPLPQPRVIHKTNAALEASVITKVEPTYPAAALTAGVFGSVVVEVSIDESGAVSSARAISGHTLLKQAAIDAARGWTFVPTTIQGKPVSATGTLTFTFTVPDYVLRNRAIEQLKREVSLNPENPKLVYRLGFAYEQSENFPDALKCYETAVRLNPEYGDALLALGNLNMRLNQYEAALKTYKKAAALDLSSDNRATLSRNMAMIYFRADRFQEAVEPFKKAIELAPQGMLYLDLGLTYLKLGDKMSAMEQYNSLKDRNSILAEQLLKQIKAN